MATFHGAEVLTEFVCDSATSVFNVHVSAFCTGTVLVISCVDDTCHSVAACDVLFVLQLRSRACY